MRKIAIIPTYHERVSVIEDAVVSLHHQVDQIIIAYNGDYNPDLVHMLDDYQNVGYIWNKEKDYADLAKFLPIESLNDDDVVYLCDDDLLYDPEYCDRLLSCLDKSGCGLISLGGKVIDPAIELDNQPDYKGSIKQKYRCFDVLPKLEIIDIPLSGVCVFRRGSMKSIDIDMAYIYAADVQLYKLCKINNIKASAYFGNKPLVVYNEKMEDKQTIFIFHTSKRSSQLGQQVKDIYLMKV
jgi:hypothetical protein